MNLSQKNTEQEFIEILDAYAGFIRVQAHKHNLLKYGLDPEDIIQEVRIRIWKLIHNSKYIFSYSSYIKKIVNSAVIDQLRKLRRNEELFNHEKQKQISEINLSYRLEPNKKRLSEELLGKAIEKLIDSRRQVVKMYLLDFSIQEIASYLNWSQDKIRNLLYRGLSDLKKNIRAMDINNENR